MHPLLIAVLAGVGFLVAYHTYGKWLGEKIFRLSVQAVCPSVRINDGIDYVPTHKSVVFGHHFTSIAGTGPIVGPAIAVMWGWLPALLWVVLGSIFIGAVHDLGALVVSLRNNGQTVGDIAGRVMNRRVRILFLCVLFMALSIVLAIFGMVIATVFRQFPQAIFPVLVQIPIAVLIGLWLHRKGVGLLLPSVIALTVMYLTVIFGDANFYTGITVLDTIQYYLHHANAYMASWSNMTWVAILLVYSYVASVLPVWVLLQPRDYINSLQLISALGLIVLGLFVASLIGGAPPVPGSQRPELTMVAPVVNWNPPGAPMIFPFLFITIACGAISGFHCLVSSGTSSKQLKSEPDARFVGYGGMLTEGFLAVLVILACTAGLGLGLPLAINTTTQATPVVGTDGSAALVGASAFAHQYASWGAAAGLAKTVGAFVTGAANFVNAMGVPMGWCLALMGVLVASFAGTTLDTACRLQRYVVQELATAVLSPRLATRDSPVPWGHGLQTRGSSWNPLTWLTNMHGATVFAVVVAMFIAAIPLPGTGWGWETAGRGGLILWPLFGATNQLLGGLAFMVITFYLWRRGRPIWFLIVPATFMLVMPAWAMLAELPGWVRDAKWTLAGIATATLVLEVWMIAEAALMFPRVRNVLEGADQASGGLEVAIGGGIGQK